MQLLQLSSCGIKSTFSVTSQFAMQLFPETEKPSDLSESFSVQQTLILRKEMEFKWTLIQSNDRICTDGLQLMRLARWLLLHTARLPVARLGKVMPFGFLHCCFWFRTRRPMSFGSPASSRDLVITPLLTEGGSVSSALCPYRTMLKYVSQKKKKRQGSRGKYWKPSKVKEGNRTLTNSLEGCCSTVKLLSQEENTDPWQSAFSCCGFEYMRSP